MTIELTAEQLNAVLRALHAAARNDARYVTVYSLFVSLCRQPKVRDR